MSKETTELTIKEEKDSDTMSSEEFTKFLCQLERLSEDQRDTLKGMLDYEECDCKEDEECDNCASESEEDEDEDDECCQKEVHIHLHLD